MGSRGTVLTEPVLDLDALRAAAEAATPGPWGWFGNTKVNDIYLATRHHGRMFVMRFTRWGMTGAQPMFRSAPTHDGYMVRASTLARYEVLGNKTISHANQEPYRYDISSVDNPDADYIAAFSPEIALALIGRVESHDRAVEMGRHAFEMLRHHRGNEKATLAWCETFLKEGARIFG